MDELSILAPLLFLLGAVAGTILSKAFGALGRGELKSEFARHRGLCFFYTFAKRFFPAESASSVLAINSLTKQINRILYAATASLYFLSVAPFAAFFHKAGAVNVPLFILAILAIVTVGLLCEFGAIYLGTHRPRVALHIAFPIASIFYLAYALVTFTLLKLQKWLAPDEPFVQKHAPKRIKDQIIELVKETEAGQLLDPVDQKLLVSVANFRDRIVREVMVPRIDITALSKEESLSEAMDAFTKDGYSRIPVYDGSIDHIIGVLLYKDVLAFYHDHHASNGPDPHEAKVATLIKPAVYTPETKKIAHLLQEFRGRQNHFAVVVDEYGGTEGIVTIEDILEEIVGEIADEYDDVDEELLFTPLPDGSWIVDAKMNIIDIEKELKIDIPSSPEYDTLGGYVFHKAKEIPSKGWKILHDQFALEVLSSTERAIEKIKITPIS